jgi:hypothetical protein
VIANMAAALELISSFIGRRWAPSLRKLGGHAAAAAARLRDLAPYALIELVLPGGSIMALLLWLLRRRRTAPRTVLKPPFERHVGCVERLAKRQQNPQKWGFRDAHHVTASSDRRGAILTYHGDMRVRNINKFAIGAFVTATLVLTGTSWTFVEGQNVRQENVAMIIPEYGGGELPPTSLNQTSGQ